MTKRIRHNKDYHILHIVEFPFLYNSSYQVHKFDACGGVTISTN